VVTTVQEEAAGVGVEHTGKHLPARQWQSRLASVIGRADTGSPSSHQRSQGLCASLSRRCNRCRAAISGLRIQQRASCHQRIQAGYGIEVRSDDQAGPTLRISRLNISTKRNQTLNGCCLVACAGPLQRR